MEAMEALLSFVIDYWWFLALVVGVFILVVLASIYVIRRLKKYISKRG